jgi:hypothetical protein
MWEFEMFKLICTALVLSVVAGSSPAGAGTPRFQSDPTPKQEVASAPQSPAAAKEPVEIPEEDAPEGELEPAALNLDVSNSSTLIEELYRATRETKEKEILAHIEQAKQLVDKSDLKAVDSHGRTALHWAVFGSSYNIKPSVLVAYEEIADTLIQRGVDINKEDVYQDTALDYLLYSPSFEMQTLLIEHGATSGFLVTSTHYVTEAMADEEVKVRAAALSRKVDLMPGLTLSLRLSGSVYSDRSRTGDPIEATVTYPLCKNGENIACNEGELLVPPGTKVNGTILFAAKAPNKYSRPRLILDFSNVLHKNNQKSPLYARVIDVDNARETVRNNEILGIIQPHASTKVSLAMAALGASNPIAGYTIKGVQTIYGLSIRREIMFPAGTDLQVQIVRPSILKQKEPWDGYRALPIDATLQHLVSSAPMRTASKSKVLSDPTNLMFLGNRKQIIAAFQESGWLQASDLGVKSAIKAAQATVRQTGYSDAPVSALLLQDRLPDLVFQKSLDTFAKRHHLRIWKLTDTYLGREVWVAAATHDIATTNSRAATKWSHRIDPHIDRERDWVESDLLFSGTAEAYADVDRPKAPRKLENATGDDIVTDGKMSVVLLAGKATDEKRPSPMLTARPTQ